MKNIEKTVFAALFFCALNAQAALTTEEIVTLCAQADDTHDCARQIEAAQIKKLPAELAQRGTGDESTTLTLSLSQGLFNDTASEIKLIDKDGKAYTVWDYWPPLNAFLLLVLEEKDSYYLWLSQLDGKTVRLPAEPVFAAGNKRFATADFCDEGCRNEVAIWQIRQGLPVKTRTWQPKETWDDAEASWVSPDQLRLEYRVSGSEEYQEMTVSPDKTYKNKKNLLQKLF
jgi:hypothetical protein